MKARNGHRKVPVLHDEEEAEGSVLFKIVDGYADGSIINDLLFVSGSGDEGGGGELVDATREALGVIGDALESVVGK